jgi:hypothetical protein
MSCSDRSRRGRPLISCGNKPLDLWEYVKKISALSELVALRSNLQYASDELQSLTNADLSDLTRPIRKRILIELFAVSPSLTSQSKSLGEITQIHDVVIGKCRRENDSRDRRTELEQKYRKEIMRIVLEGLTLGGHRHRRLSMMPFTPSSMNQTLFFPP